MNEIITDKLINQPAYKKLWVSCLPIFFLFVCASQETIAFYTRAD